MTPEEREEIIRRLAAGEELSPEWARILFPPEKREYELVYHGKEREEDILADTLDAWIKSTAMGFYQIDYAWKKGEHPKRGKFSPDFFVKAGNLMLVVEVKHDDELREPSEENGKKNEYAVAHFERVNEHLQEAGSPIPYKFNFLTPKNFGTYFQYLREGHIVDYRSELDVKLAEEV